MYLLWCCVLALTTPLAVPIQPAQAVVGGAPAAAPEPDAAVVFVQRHGHSARLEGIKNDKIGYYSFVGLRYAEPPVGERRFQRPVRQFLAGEILANKHCPPCPQRDPRQPGRVIGHEDCLCLNVFAPKMPGDEQGCPVVFFIHGGNYQIGSTGAYGGQHLAKKDTILVTAQYRLGSLGYLSTGQRDASGNAGLFDLRAAMSWVNEYIEFFGGDPTRVVVMGQGSGGSAASVMALSSEGRSARGVAALSGVPLSPGAIRSDPAKHAKELADHTDCPSSPAERLIICLKKLPVEKIIQADMNLNSVMVDTKGFLEEISGRIGAGARVEGKDDSRHLPPLVSEQPVESLNKKEERVPLLTGVTSAETTKAVLAGKYSQFLKDQLSATQDFIKNDVVGGLQNVVRSVEGLIPINTKITEGVQQILPLEDYYQTLFDNSLRMIDGLMQIAEATGDALFNFPAYQTVRAWSSGGPAFLYSFEHVGNLSKGSHFLPGLALTGIDNGDSVIQKEVAKGPSHGDELAYIFESLDEEGKPIEDEVSNTDARVRDNFVSLISKFAHELSPIARKNNSNLIGLTGLLPFSSDNEQYIKIKDEITLEKNFRFCQMGLWGDMAERISGAICKNLLGDILKLTKLPLQPSLPAVLPVNPQIPVVSGVLPISDKSKQNYPSTKKIESTSKPTLPVRLPFRF